MQRSVKRKFTSLPFESSVSSSESSSVATPFVERLIKLWHPSSESASATGEEDASQTTPTHGWENENVIFLDRFLFEKKYLRCKISSFTRQLNMYGFRIVDNSSEAKQQQSFSRVMFSHPYFTRTSRLQTIRENVVRAPRKKAKLLHHVDDLVCDSFNDPVAADVFSCAPAPSINTIDEFTREMMREYEDYRHKSQLLLDQFLRRQQMLCSRFTRRAAAVEEAIPPPPAENVAPLMPLMPLMPVSPYCGSIPATKTVSVETTTDAGAA